MNVPTTIDAAGWLGKHLAGEDGGSDLARAMLQSFAEVMMSAQAQMLCEADYREHSDVRVNSRNGYRVRPWDTRVGTIDLAVPKLREGTYYPDWLLQPRSRAEQALTTVVAQAYLEGVSTAGSVTWSRRWASRGSLSPRSRGSPPTWTPRWPSSATGPSTPAPTATCGSTP